MGNSFKFFFLKNQQHPMYPDTESTEGYKTHGAFIVTYILFFFDVMIQISRSPIQNPLRDTKPTERSL